MTGTLLGFRTRSEGEVVTSSIGGLQRIAFGVAVVALLFDSRAKADAITDWNQKAADIVVAAKLTPAAGSRILAIAQTAVYDSVNAITKRYPRRQPGLESEPGASIEAAVAAANHLALTKLLPSQQAVTDNTYKEALAAIAEGPAKAAGIAVGEKAAAAVLASRADDGAEKEECYRPVTAPGVYVPTTIPIACVWPDRRPWLMAKPDQFRPGPPPQLSSELWARDYNEIKAVGGKKSTRRTQQSRPRSPASGK